ncbi:MAG: hypothetical protein ACREVW_01095 [Burkholderiales bacterium]
MNARIEQDEHARQNAQGWAQSIAAMVAAMHCDYARLQELRDEREALEPEDLATWNAENRDEFDALTDDATIDGDLQESSDKARERIQESPLSAQVRSGWTSPGEPMEAEQFEILLSTGGPALRIMGELDEHKKPHRAWLEYQDWGTPWTEYHAPEQCDHDTLLAFCTQFYFGE